MKYVDEFRNKNLVAKISARLRQMMPARRINIMEVCGTHTQSFLRFGLEQFLPDTLRLISGPGCPVCVSTPSYIRQALALAGDRNNIILSFGDLLRLPAGGTNLLEEKTKGADVRVVYSPLDSVTIAGNNPQKKIIFLAVGFETTAPAVALAALAARKSRIDNLFFLCALKLMPPVLRYLVKDTKHNIHGFLLPGHVSSIIGTLPYRFLAEKYKKACCVTGFEPLDILEGLYFLLRQIKAEDYRIDNQYNRVVREKGNTRACEIMKTVFKKKDASWRGLGVIADSGLGFSQEFRFLDAEKRFGLGRQNSSRVKESGCICAKILKGKASPDACGLFSSKCTPLNPIGPCMVSSEGTCNSYYRYRR